MDFPGKESKLVSNNGLIIKYNVGGAVGGDSHDVSSFFGFASL